MDDDERLLLDLPMVLETERLLLRPPQAGDGQALYDARLDGYDDLIKWLQMPQTPASLEECELECRKQAATWILRSDMRFMCFDRGNRQLLGRIAFPDILCVWSTPLVGVSYFIRKSQQGRGVVTEAVNALCQFAFDFFKAKKIEIKCDEENVASFRVPEKLGFELEFTQKGIWPKPGNPLAAIRTYALFSKKILPPLEVSYRDTYGL